MAIAPVTVLKYNEESKKYQFDVTQFSKIAASDEIKDLPVAVVSIIGDYRKGKSFLLNYFLRYLKRYDQEDWLGDPNEPLQGFAWKQGAERCTTGIALWPESLIVTRKDGTKIAVILMDTQGFFDDQTKHEDCNYIFAISSLLSSVQIYNQMDNIHINDFTLLSKLSVYSKEKKRFTGFKGLQKLLLLIRDWSANCDYPFGADGGKQFLESINESQLYELNENWKTINDCYSQVDCFLMPHPGLPATRRGFEGRISELNYCFVTVLNELVIDLFSPENILIKENNGEPMKMWEFVTLFRAFYENLENDVFIPFNKLLEIEYENQAKNASMLAMAEFFKKYTELNPRKDIKRINYSVGIARASATLFYHEKTKDFNPEIAVNCFEDFNGSLEEYLENFFYRYAAESNDESDESSTQNSWYHRMFSNVSTAASFLLSFLGRNWYYLQLSLDFFNEIYSRRANDRKNQRNRRQNNRRRK